MELTRLDYEYKRLRRDVDYLLANTSSSKSDLSAINQYITMLQNSYGFTKQNVDLYNKYVRLDNQIKQYLDNEYKYWKPDYDSYYLTFNIDTDVDYSDYFSTYNFDRTETWIGEFVLIDNSINIFSEDSSISLIISRDKNDPTNLYYVLNNGDKMKLKYIYDKCMSDTLSTIGYSYPSLPIFIKYDLKNNLLIPSITITKKTISMKWNVIMTNFKFHDLIFNKPGIGYLIGLEDIVPSPLISCFQSHYGKMLKSASLMIMVKEQNIPGSMELGLTGANSFNYINELYKYGIKEEQFNYGQVSSKTVSTIPSLGSQIGWKTGLITTNNQPFAAVAYGILGIHDNNDREHGEEHRQVVVLRGGIAKTQLGLDFDESNLHQNVDQIVVKGAENFRIPILVTKTSTISKKSEQVKAEIRLTQTVESINLNDMVSLKGEDVLPIAIVTAGQMDYVNQSNVDTNTRQFNYVGKDFMIGFGAPKGKIDNYLARGKMICDIQAQVLIDGSKMLYASQNDGEIEISILGNTISKDLTFERTIINEGGLDITYYGTNVFSLGKFERDIGNFLKIIDKAEDDKLSISKFDSKRTKLINPTDNLADNYINTDFSAAGHWNLVKGKDMFDVANKKMAEDIGNIQFCSVPDEGMFQSRQINSYQVAAYNVDRMAFGWNGQMKNGINSWSDFGYLAESPCSAKIDMSGGNGWYDNRSELVKNVGSSDWGSKQVIYESQIRQISLRLAPEYDFQPDYEVDFKVISLAVNAVMEIDTLSEMNILDPDNQMYKLRNLYKILLASEKDLYNRIDNLEFKIDKITDVINQMVDALSEIQKFLRNMSQPSIVTETMQIILQSGFVLLETFFPGVALIIAPIVLIISGIVDITQGDLLGGIFSIVCGGLIIGYYHLPSFIDYSKRFVNRFSKYKNLSNPFSKWIRNLGNSTRKIFYHVTGKYNILNEEIEMREFLNIATNDMYVTTFDITNVVTTPIATMYNLNLTDDVIPNVEGISVEMTRLFYGFNNEGKKSIYSVVLTVSFNLIQKRRRYIRVGKDNFDVKITSEFQYHKSILQDGGIEYITITKENYKEYIKLRIEFDTFLDLITKAILIDSKSNLASIDKKMFHFTQGLALKGYNDKNFINDNQSTLNGLAYFASQAGANQMMNIVANVLGKYGNEFKYVV